MEIILDRGNGISGLMNLLSSKKRIKVILEESSDDEDIVERTVEYDDKTIIRDWCSNSILQENDIHNYDSTNFKKTVKRKVAKRFEDSEISSDPIQSSDGEQISSLDHQVCDSPIHSSYETEEDVSSSSLQDYPKPTFTYTSLIALALKNSSSGHLTVQEIYKFIQENFPFYRRSNLYWKNSIRHNLSVSHFFKKYYSVIKSYRNRWMIKSACAKKLDEMMNKQYKKYVKKNLAAMAYPTTLVKLMEREKKIKPDTWLKEETKDKQQDNNSDELTLYAWAEKGEGDVCSGKVILHEVGTSDTSEIKREPDIQGEFFKEDSFLIPLVKKKIDEENSVDYPEDFTETGYFTSVDPLKPISHSMAWCNTSMDPLMNKYSCNSCDYSTNYKIRLSSHMKTHNNPNIKAEEFCKEDSLHILSVMRNINARNSAECPEDFIEITRQYDTSVNPLNPFSFSSAVCNTSRYPLMDKYFCNSCDYSTNSKSKLSCHMTAHNDSNTSKYCQHCDTFFYNSTEYQMHMKQSDKKQHQCNLCCYSSSQKYTLYRHIIHKHNVGIKDIKYSCRQCYFTCKYHPSLFRHMKKKHTSKDPYPCDLCNASFKNYVHFKQHRFIKHKKHLMTCNLCDFTCRNSMQLLNHNYSKHQVHEINSSIIS